VVRRQINLGFFMTIAVEAPRKQDGEDVREKGYFFIASYQGHKRAQTSRTFVRRFRSRLPYEGRSL